MLSGMGAALTALAARAVVGTDGEVWTANSAFCSLVALDEPALRHLGWRQLVHPADRQYVAAHLVEILAGSADLREFDLRLVPPHGRDRRSTAARPTNSAAARRVKVSSSTRWAGTPRSSNRPTRAVSVVVFPVPAPASTSSGPPSCSTAPRCSSFSSNTRSTLPAAQRSVGAPLRESR